MPNATETSVLRFSPGPWQVERHQDFDDDCWPNGKTSYSVKAGSAIITPYVISLANARLIAQAPAMYEVVKAYATDQRCQEIIAAVEGRS